MSGERSGAPAAALRSAYAAAGVDVAAGERAVELIRQRIGQRGAGAGGRAAEVLRTAGGFASAVAVPSGLREPVLVSSTDGVGTKTAIARALKRFDTLGHDLVAMCADDVVCAGARPYLFLDYVVVGRIAPMDVAQLVGGIVSGCELAGCTLVGGETAEHPSLMDADDFDLAGFCSGFAEREQLLDGSRVRAGDTIVGIASSGLHANGYSLVRSLIVRYSLELSRPYLECVRRALGEAEVHRVARDEPNVVLATLGDVLLTPTRIYAPDVLTLRDRLDAAGTPLAALAHITGGGLARNAARVLPDGLGARIAPDSWPLPSVFRLVSALSGMEGAEMRATLNGGVGMVAVVPPDAVGTALGVLAVRGLGSWPIGEVVDVRRLDGERYVETAG